MKRSAIVRLSEERPNRFVKTKKMMVVMAAVLSRWDAVSKRWKIMFSLVTMVALKSKKGNYGKRKEIFGAHKPRWSSVANLTHRLKKKKEIIKTIRQKIIISLCLLLFYGLLENPQKYDRRSVYSSGYNASVATSFSKESIPSSAVKVSSARRAPSPSPSLL